MERTRSLLTGQLFQWNGKAGNADCWPGRRIRVCSKSADNDTFDELGNKNLCGRDGRTICDPLRVPKSTYVTLAHKRKPKFFYFGCSLVRQCNCKQSTSANGTDGQTDRQTECDAICGPLLGRRAA